MIKKETILRNFSLEGVEVLRAEMITKRYNYSKFAPRELVDENIEKKTFFLREVTKEELANIRKSPVPSFVLKTEGKFYYTEIPDNINFVGSNLTGEHKCAAFKRECSRLSAAPDNLGGCAKVRDECSCIENYPWITKGYESFNTKQDSLVISECDHYIKCGPRKKYTAKEIYNLKLSITQFVWDDVESIEDSRRRKKKQPAVSAAVIG